MDFGTFTVDLYCDQLTKTFIEFLGNVHGVSLANPATHMLPDPKSAQGHPQAASTTSPDGIVHGVPLTEPVTQAHPDLESVQGYPQAVLTMSPDDNIHSVPFAEPVVRVRPHLKLVQGHPQAASTMSPDSNVHDVPLAKPVPQAHPNLESAQEHPQAASTMSPDSDTSPPDGSQSERLFLPSSGNYVLIDRISNIFNIFSVGAVTSTCHRHYFQSSGGAVGPGIDGFHRVTTREKEIRCQGSCTNQERQQCEFASSLFVYLIDYALIRAILSARGPKLALNNASPQNVPAKRRRVPKASSLTCWLGTNMADDVLQLLYSFMTRQSTVWVVPIIVKNFL